MEPHDKDKFRELHRQIRDVLIDEWDPIGVKDFPEAADEYDSYIGKIHGLLLRDAPVSEISQYLGWVEVDQMGLGGDAEAVKAARDAVAASLKKLV